MPDFENDYVALRQAVIHKSKKRNALFLLSLSSIMLLLLVLLLIVFAFSKRNRSSLLTKESNASYRFGIEKPSVTEDPIIASIRALKNEADTALLNKQAAQLKFNSQNLLLLSLSDDKILFSQKAFEPAYPASLVKMMTAIIAVEKIKDLEQEIKMSEEMYRYFYQIDASMAGYLAHEKTTPKELLYGLFLASGAECSTQLALTVTPDLSKFVDLMNAKAKEIGMFQTHFTNVTGLHEPEQITTAYDMAKCLAYAAKYTVLRDIMYEKSHRAPKTEEHPNGFEYNNLVFKRFELVPNLWRVNWRVLGGKTGYTAEAKQTMATLLQHKDKDYVLVTLNAQFSKGLKANPLALDVFTCMEKLLLPNS